MRSPLRADVYLHGNKVGQLRRTDTGYRFTYRADWSGPALAPGLPVADDPILTAALPPFFAALLPQGQRRRAVARGFLVDADDEFQLLLAIGADLVGAVQVVHVGEPADIPEPLAVVTRGVVELSFADLTSDDGLVDVVGFPGTAVKISADVARINSTPQSLGMIKIAEPQQIFAEAWALGIARKLPLPVVDHHVVYDLDGLPALYVQRFDRAPGIDQPRRRRVLHLSQLSEDALASATITPASLCAAPRVADPVPHVTDPSLAALDSAIAQLSPRCPATLLASRALIVDALFCYLIGDDRPHSAEYCLVEWSAGDWRVAPLHGRRPHLSSSRSLSTNQARTLLTNQGLPSSAIDRVFVALAKATADAPDAAPTALGLTGADAQVLRDELITRHAALIPTELV